MQESDCLLDRRVGYASDLAEALAEFEAEYVDLEEPGWQNDEDTLVFTFTPETRSSDCIAEVMKMVGQSRPSECDWQYVETEIDEVIVFRLWWD